MIKYAKLAVTIAKEQGMYVVLDADALWMIGQDLALIRGYRRAVLTPNVMEFKRLSENVVRTHFVRVLAKRGRLADRLAQDIDPKIPPEQRAMHVSRALGGVTVLEKGSSDIICTNTGEASKEQAELNKVNFLCQSYDAQAA